MHYSLAQFVSEINSLGTEMVYPYASLSGRSTNSCKLVSVDSNSGAIKFTRNGGAQVEKISSANVSKLVDALATNKAVEINSLFGGSGNARSVLEAFVVHTPHVFLCKIDGKKHVYYSHDKSHPSGQIEIDMSPNVPVYSGSVAVRKADDLGLVVGMRSEESPYGVVTVIDDDDYSYQVLCINESKHSKGIRTISKILVKEWICAVTKDPNKNANKIRGNLCGKSDIDKFEYGNEGVLIKLAKMATGQASHTMVNVSEYWGRRLGRSEKPEDKKDELPPNVDRLSFALKLFAEKRSNDTPGGVWDSYDAWTKSVRSEFVSVDESLLSNSAFNYLEYIRKYTVSGFVANTSFARHSSDEKYEVLKFLKGQKDSPKSASWYIDVANRLVVGGNQVDGMTPKSLLYFMSELHPEEFAAWTEPTYEQLEFLGLHKGAAPSDLTIETYEDCKAKQQLIVAKMKELKIGKASDDPSAPDYRTANEFLWWLGQDDNKDLIKEKVMSKQWKSVNSKDKVKNGTRKLSDALAGNDMLKRLVAALRTKPFAILAGHSGTGKSQLVRRLAYMTCNNELLIKEGEGKTAPGNYCMVQVKPNWHDSTDLLGYYSEMGERHFVNTPFVEFICKAYAYPDTPFFVCLDEMNLAPVEQYFAEYLSAIESMENKGGVWLTDPLVEVDKTGEKDASGKEKVDVEIVDQIMKGAASKEAADWIQAHGLTIPKNLFVVGTVNMDETTCQFSRKVLDRAMTLLMNDVKFSDMAASKKPSDEELLDEAGLDFFLEGEERGTVGAAESALLDGINEPLANTPFVVAYRFANEYALYEAALAKLNGVDLAAANDEEKKNYAMEALDHVVMMKLLPRIHGERGTVRVLFEGGKRGDKNVPGLESKLPSGGLSVDMMKKILERRDEYLTFWP